MTYTLSWFIRLLRAIVVFLCYTKCYTLWLLIIFICQLMVASTNLLPIGIPNLGCSKEGNVIQCNQLNCATVGFGTAWLWSRPHMRILSSSIAPLCSNPHHFALPCFSWLHLLCSALLCPRLLCCGLVRHLRCFSFSLGISLQSSVAKGSTLPEPNEDFKTKKHLPNWLEWSCSDQLGEDANGDTAAQLQLDGESLNSVRWTTVPGTLL